LQFSKNSDPRVGYKSCCSLVEFIETNEHLEKALEKFENEFEWNENLNLKKFEFMHFHHAFASNFDYIFFNY
jgi:hypothetical protein